MSRLYSTILVATGFIAGYVVGYSRILGELEFNLSKLPDLSGFFDPIGNFFYHFLSRPPAVDFLSEVIAFEIAIVAFLIPLSLEMIARISDRYGSSVVTALFDQEITNKLLLPALLVNLFLVVGLRFLAPNPPSSTLWFVCAWLSLVGFLALSVLVYLYFLTLKSYISSPRNLLTKLFKKANDAIK